MGIIIDLVIIVIILLSTYLAYKKGLISLAVQLIAIIISLAITLVLYKPVTNVVVNVTNIDETIQDAILKKANTMISENNEKSDKIIETIQSNMLPETAEVIAVNIIQGAVIIILYIVGRVILRFVSIIANIVSKIPIISQINKTGGIIYGLLRGIIIVYAILLIINLSGTINPQNPVYTDLEESYIGKTMATNNILNVLFNKI